MEEHHKWKPWIDLTTDKRWQKKVLVNLKMDQFKSNLKKRLKREDWSLRVLQNSTTWTSAHVIGDPGEKKSDNSRKSVLGERMAKHFTNFVKECWSSVYPKRNLKKTTPVKIVRLLNTNSKEEIGKQNDQQNPENLEKNNILRTRCLLGENTAVHKLNKTYIRIYKKIVTTQPTP